LVAGFLQQIAKFFTCGTDETGAPAPCAILTKNWEVGLVILAVVAFSAAMSLLRMRVTQNYVNVQFFAYAAAIFLIGLAGVVWLAKGNPSATSFAGFPGSQGWDTFQGDKLALHMP